MKPRVRLVCLVYSIFATIALADDARSRLLGKTAVGRDKHYAPLLFEVDKQDAVLAMREKQLPVPSNPTLLPNRVYLYYALVDKQWHYVLTNFEARLPEPMEYIRRRSVFRGENLGAKEAGQRFLLLDGSRWTRTFKSEVHDFLTQTDPPYFRVVEFLPVIKVEKKAAGQ